MKHHDIVTAIAGEFAGQTGRVIATHTYPEAGQYASVRFQKGSLWLNSSGELRHATPSEVAAYNQSLLPAAA